MSQPYAYEHSCSTGCCHWEVGCNCTFCTNYRTKHKVDLPTPPAPAPIVIRQCCHADPEHVNPVYVPPQSIICNATQLLPSKTIIDDSRYIYRATPQAATLVEEKRAETYVESDGTMVTVTRTRPLAAARPANSVRSAVTTTEYFDEPVRGTISRTVYDKSQSQYVPSRRAVLAGDGMVSDYGMAAPAYAVMLDRRDFMTPRVAIVPPYATSSGFGGMRL